MVSTYEKAGFDGINIDFESFTKADRASLVAFMAELYPRAKKAGLTVSQDVIVGSATYDHRALSRHVDYLIPMMYDEHWKTSGPGPISSHPWYARTLKRFLTQVPADKVVVGLGTYTYEWGKPGRRARSLKYADAVYTARQQNKPIEFDVHQLNSRFSYRSAGVVRQMWVLDAASAFNQLEVGRRMKVRGYAVWRLGAEDPGLWKVVPRRDTLDAETAASLDGPKRTVRYSSKTGLIMDQSILP
jgi:spore germination protein YaaH